MCGIAGTVGFGDADLLRAMTDTIAHRGPDGDGLLRRRRRLPRQPAPRHPRRRRRHAADERTRTARWSSSTTARSTTTPSCARTCWPRGHRLAHDLRHRAPAPPLRGRGHRLRRPTERHLRVRPATTGRRRKLFLVRDPLGVKPLVYASDGDRLAFGSEAKAVLASGLVDAELDEASLHLSMNVRYVPGERTFFRGHPARCRPVTSSRSTDGARATYAVHERRLGRPTTSRVAGRLDRRASATTTRPPSTRQLLSDVPVGVSLSGGIDSSSIVAMLRRRHSGPIKTFSLGFDEPTDELDDARFVAEHVRHRPSRARPARAGAHASAPTPSGTPRSPRSTRSSSTCSTASSASTSRWRSPVSAATSCSPATTSTATWRGPSGSAPGPAGDGAASRGAGTRLDGAGRRGERSGGRSSTSPSASSSGWPPPTTAPATTCCCATPGTSTRAAAAGLHARLPRPAATTSTRDEFDALLRRRRDPLEARSLRAEFATKMVSDLLHNEDTMSMAHSVESRVPLLDLELVRFAARIPDRRPLRSGHEGPAQGRRSGASSPTACSTRRSGASPSTRSSSTRRTSGPMARELLTPARLRRARRLQPDVRRAGARRRARTSGSAGTTSCCGR